LNTLAGTPLGVGGDPAGKLRAALGHPPIAAVGESGGSGENGGRKATNGQKS